MAGRGNSRLELSVDHRLLPEWRELVRSFGSRERALVAIVGAVIAGCLIACSESPAEPIVIDGDPATSLTVKVGDWFHLRFSALGPDHWDTVGISAAKVKFIRDSDF